jgi:peptidoglycan/LPS O-acetylase OafA/YrhL
MIYNIDMETYETAVVPQPNATPPAMIFGAFGIYRYVLATAVMLSHMLPLRWHVSGKFAVFGFFILSGYVVAYILHYTYLPLKNGLLKYAVNRALRVYPAFWIASLFMLWVLVAFPSPVVAKVSDLLGYPQGAGWKVMLGWLALNLSATTSLLFLGYSLSPVLIPIGWSLGVEIFYWMLIPVMLLRRRARMGLFLFAVCYTLVVVPVFSHSMAEFSVLGYTSPMAGSLPFGIGLLCFLRKLSEAKPLPHWAGISSIALQFLLMLMPDVVPHPDIIGLYLSTFLCTIIVLYLGRFDQREAAPLVRRIDAFLGDLAYPLFLMHLPTFLLIYILMFSFKVAHPAVFVLFAAAVCNISALLLHFVVEYPVSRLRRRLKGAARLRREDNPY